MDQLRTNAGLKTATCSSAVERIRRLLTKILIDQTDGEMLGRPGTVVQIDETYFTRRKINKAGFGGRTTKGQQTIVLGFLELDLETRQSTGRTFLEIIPETKRPWIEARIRARVMVGATIWTDGHHSYIWFGKSGSGYKWSFITHRHGEFSCLEYPN